MRKCVMAHDLEKERDQWKQSLENAIDAPSRQEKVNSEALSMAQYTVVNKREDSGFVRGVVVEDATSYEKRQQFFTETITNLVNISEEIGTLAGDTALSAKLRTFIRSELDITSLAEIQPDEVKTADMYEFVVSHLNQEQPRKMIDMLPSIKETVHQAPIIEVVNEVLLEGYYLAVKREDLSAAELQPLALNIDKLMTQKLTLEKLAEHAKEMTEAAQQHYVDEQKTHPYFTQGRVTSVGV